MNIYLVRYIIGRSTISGDGVMPDGEIDVHRSDFITSWSAKAACDAVKSVFPFAKHIRAKLAGSVSTKGTK